MLTRGSGCCEPSVACFASIATAAAFPIAIPFDFNWPLRIRARSSPSRWSRSWLLRRQQCCQRIVCSLRDCRVRRAGTILIGRLLALEAADNRVHRLEHGDVHDRNRSGCSAGPYLLAEDAVLARRDRSVVEPAASMEMLFQRRIAVEGGGPSTTSLTLGYLKCPKARGDAQDENSQHRDDNLLIQFEYHATNVSSVVIHKLRRTPCSG